MEIIHQNKNKQKRKIIIGIAEHEGHMNHNKLKWPKSWDTDRL